MDIGKYILVGTTPVPEPDVIKWAMWLSSANRVVKGTYIDNDIHVSTVFLGLDHNYTGGTPILFETMVFGGEFNDYQRRYSTWEEAEKGHEKILQMVAFVTTN